MRRKLIKILKIVGGISIFMLTTFFLMIAGSDDVGLGRNFCTKKSSYHQANVAYHLRIDRVEYLENVCRYQIAFGEPLKTTLMFRLFGLPNVSEIQEMSSPSKSSFGGQPYLWAIDEVDNCRPIGDYLLVGDSHTMKEKYFKYSIRCNWMAIIPIQYTDEVMKLLP